MAQNIVENNVNSGPFSHLYAVDFGPKRVMRPETEKFVLGRAENSDLVISSPRVSDKHCEITCSGDSWFLQNLSPDGTSLVGKCVALDDTVPIADGSILKLGSVYVQCKSDIESAQPPIRVLKFNVLIGDKCYLAAVPDDQSESENENNSENSTENVTVNNTEGNPENEPVQAIENLSSDSSTNAPAAEVPENDPPGETTGEINGIINDMAIENQHIVEELKQTKEALKKALIEKNEMESITADLQEQLRLYQEETENRGAISELLEIELQCSICNELMVDAVTLDCSHSYCEFCLREWKRTDNICPLCRKNIAFECKTRVIDNLIDRIIWNLSDDTQKRRKELAETRKGGHH